MVSNISLLGNVIDQVDQNGNSGILVRLQSNIAINPAAYVLVLVVDELNPSNPISDYAEFLVGNYQSQVFFPGIPISGVRAGRYTIQIQEVLQKTPGGSGGSVTTTTSTYRSIIPDCDMGTYNGVYAPLFSGDNPSSSIWLSVTQSSNLYYNKVIQDTSYENMETAVFPVFLQLGDMVKLKDQVAYASRTTEPEKIFWPEKEEYRIISTQTVLDNSGSIRVQLNLDRPINRAVVDSNKIPNPISYFIFNKHVPDETNLILRYDPKSNIPEDGIVYPQYLTEQDKIQAGNTIKSLKSQNLI
jgi:hypothetical protein